jgi:hypothetical protein
MRELKRPFWLIAAAAATLILVAGAIWRVWPA